MFSVRTVFVFLPTVLGSYLAEAGAHPKAPTTRVTEARNEAPTPSFPGQIEEARRVASFLADALVLNNAQQHALTAYTIAEREALALAATAAAASQAQQEYLLAVRRVLATSQWQVYGALRQQYADTLLPLDGPELALR